MKLRFQLFALLAVLAATVCSADTSEWHAMSDTQMPLTDQNARDRLESLQAQLAADVEANGTAITQASSSSLTPEMAAQMRGFRDQAITQIKQQLSQIDPAKDPDNYKALTNSLEQTRASYAKILGETSAPSAQESTTKELQVPAFGTAQPTLPKAVDNLQKLLALNSTEEARHGFQSSED